MGRRDNSKGGPVFQGGVASTGAEVEDINEPTWSADSKFIYFDTTGDHAALYRVGIADRQVELVTTLKNIVRDNWSGVTPDGSPLIVKDTIISEIYALTIQWTSLTRPASGSRGSLVLSREEFSSSAS